MAEHTTSAEELVLRVTGEVAQARALTLDDLRRIGDEWQIDDASRLDPRRGGRAVKLAGILATCGLRDSARYLGLHAATDDFHASIPLAAVYDTAVLIYELDGQPLPRASGGPLRFFIPDYGDCHTTEVDECANVKFVDHLELTADKGFDNRPHDDAQHAELHRP